MSMFLKQSKGKQSLCIRIEFNSQRKLITIIFNVESPLCNIPNFSASREVHIEKNNNNNKILLAFARLNKYLVHRALS